jgi:DNA-binding CsgD family transcriptional regulator
VDLLEEISRLPLVDFPNALLRACLYELFDCSYVVWHWFDAMSRRGVNITPATPREDIAALRSSYRSGDLFKHHGLWRWFSTTGNTAPQTLDRVPLGVYGHADRCRMKELFAPLGAERQLCIPLTADPRRRMLAVVRSVDDFSAEELLLAHRLQRPLVSLTEQFRMVAPSGRTSEAAITAAQELTSREFAVVRMAMAGSSSTAIGRKLLISPRTVEKHLENAYRKLQVHNRAGAWHIFYEAGPEGSQPGQ